MNRRAFLGTSFSAAMLAASRLSRAQNCSFVAPGVSGCEVKLSFPSVMLAATLQQCPEWCWAASISMVFKFFGHPVDQKSIVKQTYGALVCRTSANQEIGSDLSRSWTDDNGDSFTSSVTAAYDVDAGIVAIDNAIIVNELLNQRPLLYCNSHHAMVVCAVDYRPSLAGPVIDAVYVMDPWPPAQRVHALSQAERYPAHVGGDMHFLASLSVA